MRESNGMRNWKSPIEKRSEAERKLAELASEFFDEPTPENTGEFILAAKRINLWGQVKHRAINRLFDAVPFGNKTNKPLSVYDFQKLDSSWKTVIENFLADDVFIDAWVSENRHKKALMKLAEAYPLLKFNLSFVAEHEDDYDPMRIVPTKFAPRQSEFKALKTELTNRIQSVELNGFTELDLIEFLMDTLRPSPTTIRITESELGPILETFLTFKSSYKNWKRLHIYSNPMDVEEDDPRVGDHGAVSLARIPQLERLELGNQGLTEEGFIALATTILETKDQNEGQLTYLDIWPHDIDGLTSFHKNEPEFDESEIPTDLKTALDNLKSAGVTVNYRPPSWNFKPILNL